MLGDRRVQNVYFIVIFICLHKSDVQMSYVILVATSVRNFLG